MRNIRATRSTRHGGARPLLAAAGVLALLGSLLASTPARATPSVVVQCGGSSCAPLTATQDIWPYDGVTATPQASCGAGDLPEAQQGEAASGEFGALCNLREVARVGPKSTLALAVYDHCAYYQAGFGRGTVVVDLTHPNGPTVTATLTTPAMQYAHEGLRVSERRGLLAAMAAGVAGEGYQSPYFDAYDLTEDCARPRLVASTLLPASSGHEGTFSSDGNTFYATQVYGSGLVTAIDVRDPVKPTVLWRLTGYAAHGIETNPADDRLYITTIATPGVSAVPNALGGCNGVVTLDVSEVQSRQPDPQAGMIGYFCWEDGIAAQVPYYFTSGGRPHLVVTDEGGSIPTPGAQVIGKGTGGHARIIDISDERHPRIVSQLITQNQVEGGGGAFHYCTPDRQVDPTVVGCTSWMGNGGFRVYDVRDVRQPKELAYYSVPGNNSGSAAFFLPATGQAVYADQNHGLTVVQFVHGTWPFTSGRGRGKPKVVPAPVSYAPAASPIGLSAEQRQMRAFCGIAV